MGVIDEPIGRDPHHRKRMAVAPDGREARTRYRVLEYIMPSGGVRPGYSLLEVVLETGRTHQIRVHFSFLGHPLMGDGVYGRSSPLLGRQFLHANRLGFRHPATGELVEFRSELPPELSAVLDRQRDG